MAGQPFSAPPGVGFAVPETNPFSQFVQPLGAAPPLMEPAATSAAPAGPSATPFDSFFAQAEAAFPRLPKGLLKAVAEVESGFNPKAMGAPIANSRSQHYGQRAIGLMQFMPATAQALGIDPSDPAQAAMGAAKMLDASLTRRRGDLGEAVLDYYGRGQAQPGQPSGNQHVGKLFAALGKYNPQLVGGQAQPQAPQIGVMGNQLFVNGRAFGTNAEGIVGAAQHLQSGIGGMNPPGVQPMDPQDFAFFYSKATTPDATFGGGVKQLGASFLRGVGTLPQMALEGGAMATNKLFGTQLSGMNPLEPVAKAIENTQTLGTQAARNTPPVTGNLLTGDFQVNPNATMGSVGMQLADGLGSVLSFLGGTKALQYLGSRALATAVAGAKPLGMTLPGAAAGFAQTAGGAMSDIEHELRGKTHDQLMQESPAYADMIAQGAQPQDAQFAIIESAKRLGGTIAGAGGAVGGAVGGALAGRAFGGQGLPLVSGIRSAPLRIGAGAGIGSTGEFVQEGIEQTGQNVGQGLAMRQPITAELAGRNTAPAAFGGALTGGVVGGAFSAPRMRAPTQLQPPGTPLQEQGRPAFDLQPTPGQDMGPQQPPPGGTFPMAGFEGLLAQQQGQMPLPLTGGQARPQGVPYSFADLGTEMNTYPPSMADLYAPQTGEVEGLTTDFPPRAGHPDAINSALAPFIKNPARRLAVAQQIYQAAQQGDEALEGMLRQADEAVQRKQMPLEQFEALLKVITDIRADQPLELRPTPTGDEASADVEARQIQLVRQLQQEQPEQVGRLKKLRAEREAQPTPAQLELTYERPGRAIRTAGDIAGTVLENMAKNGATLLETEQGPSPLHAQWLRTIRSRLAENAPVMVNARKLRTLADEVARTFGDEGAPIVAAINDTIDQITDVSEPGESVLKQVAPARKRNAMFKRKEKANGQEMQGQRQEAAPASEGINNAVQEQGAAPVDVRQQAGNGPPVGGGNVEGIAAARAPKAKAAAQARQAVAKEAAAPAKKPLAVRAPSLPLPQQKPAAPQEQQQKAASEPSAKLLRWIEDNAGEYPALNERYNREAPLGQRNRWWGSVVQLQEKAKEKGFEGLVEQLYATPEQIGKAEVELAATERALRNIANRTDRLQKEQAESREKEEDMALDKLEKAVDSGEEVKGRIRYTLADRESPSARPMHKLLAGVTSMKAALEKLLGSKLLTSDQGELARQLLETQAATASLELGATNVSENSRAGLYDSAPHKVKLFKYAGAQELLHEAVHAAVYRFMATHPNDPRVKELQALFDKTKASLSAEEKSKGHYGVENVHEFVTEAFTNREFQHLLARRKLNKASAVSLWNRFTDTVRRIIGLAKNQYTVLDEVLRLGAEIAQEQAEPTNGIVFSAPVAALTQLDALTSKLPLGKFMNAADSTRKAALGFSSTFNIEELLRGKFKAVEKFSAARKGYEAIVSRLRDNSNAVLEEFDGWMADNKEMEKPFSIVMNEASRLGVLPEEKSIDEALAKAKDDALRAKDLRELRKTLDKLDDAARKIMVKMAEVSKDTYGKIIGTLLRFATSDSEFAAAFPADFNPQTATFESVGEIMDKLYDIIGKETKESKELKEKVKALRKEVRGSKDAAKREQLDALEKEYEDTKDHSEETDEFKKIADSVRQVRREYRSRKDSLYAHLGRAGDFFISFNVADSDEARAAVAEVFEDSGKGGAANAKRVFSRFETWDDWSYWRKQVEGLEDAGHITELTSGRLEQSLHQFDNTQPEFIRRLVSRINDMSESSDSDKDAKKQLLRMVRTLSIDILPETSPRRALAKRMGTPGYDQDVRRNWSKRMESMIASLASISTAKQYDDAFVAMREELNKLEREQPEEQAVLQQVMNELKVRRMLQLEPAEDTGLSRAMQLWKALGNTFFLAMSPAYIITNLMQPAHLTFPVLSGEHGAAKTSKAMFSAARNAWKIVGAVVRQNYAVDGLKGVFDARVAIDRIAGLDQRTKDVVNALIDSGQLEATFNMEMARAAKGHTGYSVDSVLNALSSFGHYSEVVNRLTAGLAAYELTESYDEAIRAIKMTQYDYSAGNVARYFGKHGLLGSFTPVALSFQQYSFQTLELLMRLALHSLKGDKAAQKAFLGVLGMTAALAGALGLPLVTAIAAAIDAVGGDDDEPYDIKASVRAWMAEVFGKEAGEVLSRGLPRAMGFDMSSRSGMQDILPFSRFLADKRALEDKFQDGAINLLGPSVGAVYNMAQGAKLLSEGDIMGGLIKGTPLAASGPLKAFKLTGQGFTSNTGVKLPMEPTVWDIFYQSVGFNPAAKAEQAEANFTVKAQTSQLQRRATELRKRAYRAFEEGDIDEQREALKDIVEFSTKNPDFGIRDLGSGMRKRAEQAAVAKHSGTGVPEKGRAVERLKEVGWANVMR